MASTGGNGSSASGDTGTSSSSSLRRLFSRTMTRGSKENGVAAAGPVGSESATANQTSEEPAPDARIGRLKLSPLADESLSVYESWKKDRQMLSNPKMQELCEQLDELSFEKNNCELQLQLKLEEEEKLVALLAARSMLREALSRPPARAWAETITPSGADSSATVAETTPAVPYKVAARSLRDANRRHIRLVRAVPGCSLGVQFRTLLVAQRDPEQGIPRLDQLRRCTFVANLQPGSVAEQAGMRVGDQILEVDGTVCDTMVAEAVHAKLNENTGTVAVLVCYQVDYHRVLLHRELVDLKYTKREQRRRLTQLKHQRDKLEAARGLTHSASPSDSSSSSSEDELEDSQATSPRSPVHSPPAASSKSAVAIVGAPTIPHLNAPIPAAAQLEPRARTETSVSEAPRGLAPSAPIRERMDSDASFYLGMAPRAPRSTGSSDDEAPQVSLRTKSGEASATAPLRPRMQTAFSREVPRLRSMLDADADLAEFAIEDICVTPEDLRAALSMVRAAWQAERRERLEEELRLRQQIAALRESRPAGAGPQTLILDSSGGADPSSTENSVDV